ncbi:MAG: translational GTPase TypA, partial [Clostridiales bacterium]|nr:translational GTPase TypA [Candidatus Coliplasma caballi]
EPEEPLQLLVSSIDYNEYVGRIGIGRIERGKIKVGQEVCITNYHSGEAPKRTKIVSLFQIDGLNRVPVEEAAIGDIVCFSGAESITIGDTVTAVDCPEALEFVKVSEPTLEMTFSVNDSPFAGREGKFVTSRQIRERLYKELQKDVSLRVSDGETTDSFKVCGRGEMHLSILIETMRREGYELSCSTPRVLYREIDGVKCEPIEQVFIDVPNDYSGTVIEELSRRKGDLISMNPNAAGTRMKIEYKIPTRCLLGYRSQFMTVTRGEGIMNTVFDSYEPFRGEIQLRFTGSLVASETGETTSYGLYNTQERGNMFLGPATKVYEGQIVGMNPKQGDIAVNPCKQKHLTAVRSSGADEKLILVPPIIFSLEEAIEFIADDELIEVTPKSIRLRKRILDKDLRLKAEAKLKNNK